MRIPRKKNLMTQMLVGQAFLIVINALILTITALALSPSIFNKHLVDAGVTSLATQTHVTKAYISSFNTSLIFSAVISLAISGILAWFFMLRIVQPIEKVTAFAETLAAGDFGAQPLLDQSIPELDRLAISLEGMSLDLTRNREEQARLLSDLAHELRTPIATVSAIVDGIEDGVVRPDSHTWQTIRDQLERVNRLSKDVREVTQNSEKVLSTMTVEIGADLIASSAYKAWAPKLEKKGIAFTKYLELDLPMLKVDPQRIGQVLSNLLENALRYTPAGGKIELRVTRLADSLLFEVEDSGQGIEPHQLPNIFDRLYRGDVARHSGDTGSGLGLTIARSIAESHQGTLFATSPGLNQGSIFRLTLPILGD